MQVEMCRVQEDYEQQCDLPPEEYLLWLEGMAKKYPEIGFYQYRLRNEKTYQHTAEELFPDDDQDRGIDRTDQGSTATW